MSRKHHRTTDLVDLLKRHAGYKLRDGFDIADDEDTKELDEIPDPDIAEAAFLSELEELDRLRRLKRDRGEDMDTGDEAVEIASESTGLAPLRE